MVKLNLNRLEEWLSPACRQAGAESSIMFCVYILKSLKDGGIYIGKTSNLSRRLSEHNGGHVSSTRSRRPLVLFEKIICGNEKEAFLLEKEFKKGYKREEIKKRFDL